MWQCEVWGGSVHRTMGVLHTICLVLIVIVQMLGEGSGHSFLNVEYQARSQRQGTLTLGVPFRVPLKRGAKGDQIDLKRGPF